MKPMCSECGGPTELASSGNGSRSYQCKRAADFMRAELVELERQERAIKERWRPHLRHIVVTLADR